MVNLDPALMNVDAIRLVHRKKLFLALALPLTLLLLVGLKLISPAIINNQLKVAYDAQDYDTALFWANALQFTNILEPHIASFNRGNIYFGKQDYSSAETEYRQSLELNPPSDKRCPIRINLSLSIEAQADIFMKNKEYDEAILAYDQAKATLYLDNCAHRSDDKGVSAEAERAKKRISHKQEEALRLRNDDPAEPDEEGQNPTGPSPSRPSETQREELKKLQEEAMTYRSRQNRYNSNRSGSNPNKERW